MQRTLLAESLPLEKLYSIRPGDILQVFDVTKKVSVRFIVHRILDDYGRQPSTHTPSGMQYIRLKLHVVMMTSMELYDGSARGIAEGTTEIFELYRLRNGSFAYFNYDTKEYSAAQLYIRKGEA